MLDIVKRLFDNERILQDVDAIVVRIIGMTDLDERTTNVVKKVSEIVYRKAMIDAVEIVTDKK